MVEGTVVGREGSQAAVPLVGVAVVVKGSLRNHAVTDLQGRYSIRVPSSTDTLQFTYLGYKPLERVVGSRTRLDVEMLSESQQVDAVVVTALGLTRKEKSLGYAVSTVGSEDLNNTVTNNWLNGMAGKVAGLNFDTSSAGPGGSIRVTLRGEGSLAYDKNEALFVVDGVPINSGMTSNTENGSYGSTVSTIDYGNGASDLNPDDIESVSVLKGPAATALYGSRAANGAIIITTKSGLKSGGLRVTFNSNVTLEQAGFWPDFQEEYGSGVYESAQIDGVTTPPEYSYWNVAADKSDTGQKITRYHARSSLRSLEDALHLLVPQLGYRRVYAQTVGGAGLVQRILPYGRHLFQFDLHRGRQRQGQFGPRVVQGHAQRLDRPQYGLREPESQLLLLDPHFQGRYRER